MNCHAWRHETHCTFMQQSAIVQWLWLRKWLSIDSTRLNKASRMLNVLRRVACVMTINEEKSLKLYCCWLVRRENPAFAMKISLISIDCDGLAMYWDVKGFDIVSEVFLCRHKANDTIQLHVPWQITQFTSAMRLFAYLVIIFLFEKYVKIYKVIRRAL